MADYIIKEMRTFIKKHPDMEILELGGGPGTFANMMLSEFPTIKNWTNYDLFDDCDCKDPRYHHIKLKDHLSLNI